MHGKSKCWTQKIVAAAKLLSVSPLETRGISNSFFIFATKGCWKAVRRVARRFQKQGSLRTKKGPARRQQASRRERERVEMPARRLRVAWFKSPEFLCAKILLSSLLLAWLSHIQGAINRSDYCIYGTVRLTLLIANTSMTDN